MKACVWWNHVYDDSNVYDGTMFMMIASVWKSTSVWWMTVYDDSKCMMDRECMMIAYVYIDKDKGWSL